MTEENKEQNSTPPTVTEKIKMTEKVEKSGIDELREHFGTEVPYRIEHWYPCIQEYTFETVFLDVDSETCRAIAKYSESVRLWRQSINFQNTLEDRLFIHEEAAKHLPVSKETLALLEALERQLDDAIKPFGEDGAFVKLSIRSPKDTAIQLQTLRVFMAESLHRDMERAGSQMDDEEWRRCGVSAFVDACCKVLRVRSGAEAMFLILHSDRVYSDITRMELTNEGNSSKVQLAVRRWDPMVVPALEFRAFVFNHTMTACTQYYKLLYDPFLAEHRQEISDAIVAFHDQYIKPRIAIPDYTIDFAISADLKKVVCVELNNLPPSAGTALFHWDNPEDRALIEKGPYQFRCNTSLPEKSFGEINEPLPAFINSLRTGGVPEVHLGFSCDCCGAGYPPGTSGIRGERYQCMNCPCSFDMCSECWNAGWGVRHATLSKNEHYPTGHKFLLIRSPIAVPVDAGEPPTGPKSAIPTPPSSSSIKPKKKVSGSQQDKDKNCIIF